MTESLSVRNVTCTSLTLKLVERFGSPALAPGGSSSGLATFGNNVTSLVSNITAGAIFGYPNHQLPTSDARPTTAKDVNVDIAPFGTASTDILIAQGGSAETLRLTLEADGHRYAIFTPSPTTVSTALKPLSKDATKSFTGIYLPAASSLTIFSSASLSTWMSYLSSSLLLSALSIPGTHNSPTSHPALPSVRCQAVAIPAQLANGIRFLDIRVQPESPSDPASEALLLVHGVFPISLTGAKYFRRHVLDPVRAFLRAHPSETVIMSIKREGPGNATDARLAKTLSVHYLNAEEWWTRPNLPTLGEARGKIVLFRRFALGPGDDAKDFGIDAQTWAYNTPHDTRGNICVQDYCEVLKPADTPDKLRYVVEQLERSGTCSSAAQVHATTRNKGQRDEGPQPLYLNFLSASNFWHVGCWPDRIARRLNPAVVRYLCVEHPCGPEQHGDGSLGVVVCDYVGEGGDWDLVHCIVGMNAWLQSKYPKS